MEKVKVHHSVNKSSAGDGVENFEKLINSISENRAKNWQLANCSSDQSLARILWEAIDQSNALQFLQRFFEIVGSPQWTNVAGQFFEEYCLLIDIDSLMLKLLLDENLSWSNGGQFLHLVDLFEKFIDIFAQRRVHVEIIVFQDQQWMWPASLRLARCVLIAHLCQNLDVKVRHFEHALCEQFRTFFSNEEPTFIFVAQGHCLEEMEKQDLPTEVALFYLNKLQVSCLALGLNTADLDDIDIELSRIYAFYTESRTSVKFLTYTLSRIPGNVFSAQPPSLSGHLVQECLAVSKDVREAALLVALSSVLVECQDLQPDVLQFAKVLLLYLSVIEQIPLRSRALPVMECNLWQVEGLEHYERLPNRV